MVNRISQQHQDALLQGGGIGGLIGMFLGRPLLGVLGGLAVKLFTTEGLADSAKKLVGDFVGSDDPLGSLGKMMGAKGEPTAEAKAEGPEPKKSGMPTWAKWGLGIVAGMTALNFVQDNLVNTFMGVPNYGMGFPFMQNQGWSLANMWNPNVPMISPGFNWWM